MAPRHATVRPQRDMTWRWHCTLSSDVNSPLLAVSIVFCMHGIASGMWVSRIPAVQETLGLGLGALGVCLLGNGLGSLLTMLPMGAVIGRVGTRRVAVGAGVGASIALALLGLAFDAPTLFGALVVFGATLGTLDVAMNAQGSAIERRTARPIMSSLHGLWSFGNMAGAALGAVLAGFSVQPRTHFLVAAPAIALVVVVAARPFVGDRDLTPKPAFVWPRGELLLVAAIMFCAVAVEGAMFDWSGVYLRRMLDASEASSAAAPTFFSAAMAIGRLAGDQITARVNASTVARVSAILAAAGLGGMIVASRPELVFGALVVVGFGLAVLVPLAFSAAGRSSRMPTGAGIAAVATVGYTAFLLAPPAIGLIAEQVTLRGSFLVLLGLLMAIVLMAPAASARDAHQH